MSVHGAEPSEIYEDKHGARWLVVSVCNEPTVRMQRIEGVWREHSTPEVMAGGVSGLMWSGFKKVLGPPAALSEDKP